MKKLLLILTLSIFSYASNLPSNSVVKIFASLSIPNYQYPWQTSQRMQVSGSGVIIKDNYIITNAHVISHAKFVQVSHDKSSKKYTAKIKYISHQADLALLEVEDKSFFNDAKPLKLSENVSTGENVTVLGYPVGGFSLSTTKGIISRIEYQNYVHSYESMLAIQIDASINSGNSGGAAINDNNEVIGIVMQSFTSNAAENIGYIIPTLIVNSFLEDIKDGKVDGYDNSSTKIQTLENKDLRDYYNIKDNKGILLYETEKNETVLKKGDILLEIEGNEILNDSSVKTKYGNQSYKYFFHRKPVGDTVKFKLRRDNEIIDVDYTLKRKNELIKYEYINEPKYIIFGGLVFAPLTKNYIILQKISTLLFEVFYELNDKAQGIDEPVIIQIEKFSHNVNEGYNPYLFMVYEVNGIKVKNFKHFVKLIDESKDKYTIINFLDMENHKYVFDTKKARDSFEEIKNIYGLTTDRKVE